MSNLKVVIVAPFWRQPGHVGNYRIDRFIRWLSERGDEVVLVRAGESCGVETTPWGTEITIRDPLGFHPDNASGSPLRRPNRLRRSLATLLFNPDPAIVWARRAANDSTVCRSAKGAQWVISSSPRESSHVAAAHLANRVDASLLVDMRDGWLDEPLDPLLQSSRFCRWREGRLESRLLRQARLIFVTSNEWQEMLQSRLPFVREKTVVLTNAYPEGSIPLCHSRMKNGPLTLIHSGRLRGSSLSRRASLLLDPLLAGPKEYDDEPGSLVFLGSLSGEDREDLASYQRRFEEAGWRIEIQANVPRQQMMERLSSADGLLLLSASEAAIPSKVFEYIPTGKPVLAACPEGSSVWRMAGELPQFFPVDYRKPDDASDTVGAFLRTCRSGETHFAVPDRYSEDYLREIFLTQVTL